MSDIAVTSGSKIYSTSYILPGCQRKFFQHAVQVRLDPGLNLSLNLLSISIQQFDSIIIKGIVACRNHNTTIKILCADCIGNTWCSSNMKKICICTGSSQSCYQSIFKHIAASSGVFTDNNLCFVVPAIIPAYIASNLKCMIYCQFNISFSSKTICSKIFSHNAPP